MGDSVQETEARAGIPMEKGPLRTIQGLGTGREAEENKDRCWQHTQRVLTTQIWRRQILEGFLS